MAGSKPCAPGCGCRRHKKPQHLWSEEKVERRFWELVDRTGECWIWLGWKTEKGYGKYTAYDGKRAKLTHRFAYECSVGPIPPSLRVLHVCDNPSCVRPDHLRVGTTAENNADCVAKKRHQRGEGHYLAKFTYEQVRAIRDRHRAGESCPVLWKEFGVSERTMHDLLKGRTYKEA